MLNKVTKSAFFNAIFVIYFIKLIKIVSFFISQKKFCDSKMNLIQDSIEIVVPILYFKKSILNA